MTTLVAKAKYVVTHTGNLGAWVAIYRGKPDGLYQFCGDNKLRGPSGTVAVAGTRTVGGVMPMAMTLTRHGDKVRRSGLTPPVFVACPWIAALCSQ